MPCFAAGGSVDGERLDGVADLQSVTVHLRKGVSEAVEWILGVVGSSLIKFRSATRPSCPALQLAVVLMVSAWMAWLTWEVWRRIYRRGVRGGRVDCICSD